MFNKKESSVYTEESIKRVVCDEQDNPLVHINITYPVMKINEKENIFDRLNRNGLKEFKKKTDQLYKKSAENYIEFAEKGLKIKAVNMSENENFKPLSAVMKCEKTYEDKNIISIFTEAYIFDGETNSETVRHSQIWNKNKAFIYTLNDILTANCKEELINLFLQEPRTSDISEEEYKKLLTAFYCPENFYLTENTLAFYYPAGRLNKRNQVKIFNISKQTLRDKKLIKAVI